MLASWAVQAGFEPPTLSVAVKQGRYVADWIDAGATIVLNVVGEQQKSLLGHFGRGFEPDENAFEGLDMGRTESGVPFLRESVGYLECQPRGHLDSGDHRIYLAEVIGGASHGDGRPMVHVRKSGSHY